MTCGDLLLELIRIRLEEVDAVLTSRLAAVRREVDERLQARDSKGAEIFFRWATDFADVGRALDELRGLARGSEPPLYLVSTLFLQDCYTSLTRDPSEDMHFVTGLESGRCRVLHQMVGFEKVHRNAAGVAGDPAATHRVLIELEARGHRLTAWMHSHPGSGAGATVPSGTDLGHQERLERGGYPAIGAIFSRDGHVRFFSRDLPFAVRVFGKGVRELDERLYQLQAD